MPDARPVVDLPDGFPPWLAAFVLEAQHETDTLREHGAEHAAVARLSPDLELPVTFPHYPRPAPDHPEARLETRRTHSPIPPATPGGTTPPPPAQRPER